MRIFYPHYRIKRVVELTVERLAEMNISALLLDVDATLKPYRETVPCEDIAAWIETMRAAGVGLCLVSNGRGRRISSFAESLGLPFVAPAYKPFPFGVRRALRTRGFDPARTAMVGDQVFADIIAGNLAGLRTVLVVPILPEQEPWFARLKRPLERLILPRQKESPRPRNSESD